MSEQRTRMIWSDLSFDAVSPEIPYKLILRQFVCTILSINKTRAEEDVRIRADSWRVCPFLLKLDQGRESRLFLFMEISGWCDRSRRRKNLCIS